MVPSCAQCGAALPEAVSARFCGSCGAAVPATAGRAEPEDDAAAVGRYRAVFERFVADGALDAHEREQLEALRQRLGLSLRTHERLLAELSPKADGVPGAGSGATRLQLFIDTETLRHFAAGTRCVLRLKIQNDGALALDPVEIYAEVVAGERLAPARGAAIFPGQSGVLPLWLVPAMPGFFELQGVIHVADLLGAHAFFRFAGLQVRVGATSDAARVSVVNIDQSSARVVDNSRTQFALPQEDRGGLVGDGEFRPVALRPLSATEAAALHPELARIVEAARTKEAEAAARTAQTSESLRIQPGASVRFTVKAERAQYEVSSVLAQGDLATIYDGRRSSDGAHVVVKLADDKADNDLMQAEVSALRLLHSEPSPQGKHLPVVLDQFHSRDGRLGTVLEYLDGFDLLKVRERLPNGLPPQHLIWLMRRTLSVLGWAHSRGVLHGNIDPAHILVRAQDHNVWLIDWCYSIINPAQTGQSFRCLNETYSPPEVTARKPPLPSSDLYSLGKCMFFVLGGDPVRKAFDRDPGGEPLDERIERFLQFCVLESPLSRAQDAWEAYRFLEHLRGEIWGPHRFIELLL